MKTNAYTMTIQIVFIILLATLLVCQGGPLPARSIQLEKTPAATATLQHPSQPRLVAQFGHSGNVMCVSFSPDGRYVLTGSSGDNTGLLWDRETGKEIRKFEGHIDSILSVAFSPDGRYVLTGSWDKTARLWDRETGKEVRKFKGHAGKIHSAAFSSDGRYVLTGSDDKTARLWDRETGSEIRRFEGHGDIFSLAFSPDGRYVLTGSEDKTAQVWDRETGKEIRKFEGHTDSILSVAFSPDGRYVLTGSGDKTARLWEVQTGKEVRRFEGRATCIFPVAFSPDGHYVLTGSEYNTAHLWDRDTGKEIRKFEGHTSDINGLAFSPDGRYVLTGSSDNTARLWDLETGQEVRKFQGHATSIQSVAFSTDGRYVLIGRGDKTARLWDRETGKEVRRFGGHAEGFINSVAFSPDGHYVLTGSDDNTARLWDRETGKEVRKFEGHANEISSVAFSPDGGYVLTGSGNLFGRPDKIARLWDRETGKEVRKFEGHAAGIFSVAFSQDGRYVLTGSGDKSARLWDRETGKEIRKFEGHAAGIFSVAFSQDGRYVLTGSGDKTARLWDRETGKEVRKFEGHEDSISSVSFSPDGRYRYVLTGSYDRTARLWDRETGKEVRKFEGHADYINSVAFSRDGRNVLTGSWDSTCRLWDAATSKELASLISFRDGTWLVATPEGRFDTNNLEEIKGFHWIMPDDPLRPLPVEIFVRDYYEPRLLPRVLKEEQFKAIRPLGTLNRVQPEVKILNVEKRTSADQVSVTVEVSAAEKAFQRDGKDVLMKTGVHDLRLYRNGQLIGQWPEAGEMTYQSLNTTSEEDLRAWRRATEIKLDKNGKATKTFPVRLPRREDLKEVEFTAYAFNLDRVKSETARQTYKVSAKLKLVPGRAYVITVGVSGNEDMGWRLTAPAQDAKLIQKTLVKNLEDSRKYEKVVRVPLITVPPASDLDDEETKQERRMFINPTKENIKTVLDILAGRKVDLVRLEQLPQGLRGELRLVQPEDLVLLSFSSHGVTDTNGEFYVLPYNLGTGSGGKVTPELLKRSISSQELSLWLSGVDAEQVVMVIDACHSGAAVEVEGFKPGPMGNPGLGQLSYDKRMPILAATQAADSAWAQGRYSFLTLALAQEGIGERRLTLTDALKYAEERVPKLYEAMMGKEETKKIQVPKLFEFKR